MGKDCTKTNENIYFKCRKEAALYDERLRSRESAADLLGVSPSSLADYELGNTKVVPVDKVHLMADLYNAPQLRTMYCKYDCPIGAFLTVATEIMSLDTIVLKLLNGLEEGKLTEVKKQLISIAAMGNERQRGLKYDSYLMKVQDDSIKGEVGMRYEIRKVA